MVLGGGRLTHRGAGMRRALVIGGSVGGLFAALALRRAGWAVQISERVAVPLAGRGAGIVTHPALRRVLDQLGLDTHRDFGVPVAGRRTLARDGSVAGVLDCPQVMTSWDRLFRLLRGAWPDAQYALGESLTGVRITPTGIVAQFGNGTVREAELLVGADGIRSGVRDACFGPVTTNYAGYVAWRGLVAESDVPADLFSCFGFCLPDGEQMLGYPVAGADNDLRPGHRRYNFVWYRPADDAALARLLTDQDGTVHAGSIPPPLIRAEIVAAMRTDADRVLAPAFATVVRATAQPFLQPIYDLECPRMVTDRVALVGDSAFVARPHLGAGVTKAAEDAWALAAALADAAVSDGLVRYAVTREAVGRNLVARARQLGAFLQPQHATADEQATAARHRTTEAVMAETALLDR